MAKPKIFLRLAIALLLLFSCFQLVLTTRVEAQAPAPIVIENAGISTPESMAYDPVDDVYLVSNINPTGPNSKGFISRISPEGKILALKWIDGANADTPLQAPSGIFVQGDTLYVVDIVSVKLFQRATGKPKGELKVPGAVSLNDEAVAPDGTVYVADLGLSFGATGLQPNGSDALYKITPDGKVSTLAKTTQLGNPNGVTVLPSGIPLVVSYNNSGEYYTVGINGKENSKKLPGSGGQFDGVITLPDGGLFITSWADKAVYRVSADGKSNIIIKNVESPADLGYDTKRGRILLPLLNLSKLIIYPVSSVPIGAPASGNGGIIQQQTDSEINWFLLGLLLAGLILSAGWLVNIRNRRSS